MAIVMALGHIAAEGKPADVITPDLLRDVYGLEWAVYPDPVSGTPVVSPR